MNDTLGMETVFKYTDYRTYLNDRFEAEKLRRKSWSYGVWARELGIKSSSTLIMICKGYRHPGPKLTAKLARHFNLQQMEFAHFEDLIQLQKTRNDSRLKVMLMERLTSRLSQKQRTAGFKLLDHETFSAISNWQYYAIREMVQLRGFREEPEWIAKKLKFKITPKQASEAVDALLRLGLLKRNAQNHLELAAGHPNTSFSDIADEAIKRYHEQTLTNARESLRNTDPSLRQISGTVFAMNVASLPKAKELIRRFQQDLCSLCEVSQGDSVYQLEMSFFPLTKIEKENQ